MVKKKKVLVGLSGGVDSALVALLLKEQGYEVIGATMSIHGNDDDTSRVIGKACYDVHEKDIVEDAKAVAEQIGIKHLVCDCVDDYRKFVLQYFKDEYLSGRTPNPCVRCNYFMKFGVLPNMVKSQGINFDYFATGHYARIEYLPEQNVYALKKGVEDKKDQSYFLYRLSQKQLSNLLFPLGEFTKVETRGLAKKYGLIVSDKPDSQDFYSGNYNDIIQAPVRKGNIIMTNGEILGTHQGFWNYTLGQRKGLGVAYSEPLYVIGLNPHTNEVVVDVEKNSYSVGCIVDDANFILNKPEIGSKLQAKIRSAQLPCDVMIKSYSDDGTEFEIEFIEEQKAVAPGQSCVLYDGDYVVGGGIIKSKF